MLDLLMKNLRLVKTKRENRNMKYATLCTGCGSILPFDVEFSTSIMVEGGNEMADRFRCRAANNAHMVYFSCKECDNFVKRTLGGQFKPVLVIPKDLAVATKVIIDNGVIVRCMGTSIVYAPYINISDGKAEYYTVIPIAGCLQIRGKEEFKTIHNLIKSLISKQYNGIFHCIGIRILSEEEAYKLEDDDERDLDDLDTPEDEQLFEITICEPKAHDTQRKVKNEADIDYKLIQDKNSKFITLISTFAESLVEMKSKEETNTKETFE